jgi:RNA ligase (TIGR02306 family)
VYDTVKVNHYNLIAISSKLFIIVTSGGDMSEFIVDVRKVTRLLNHTNADKLSICNVEGLTFNVVVAKEHFKLGDLVVYFPVDSILPNDLVDYLGLTGKLSGKNKNRITTIKLRGEPSQGFVCPLNKIESKYGKTFKELDDLTEILGIVKYEQPMIKCNACNLLPLPNEIPVYDIEGCDRYESIVQALMDSTVYITEKIEGQNFGISSFNGNIIINQRNFVVQQIEGKLHSFYEVTTMMQLDQLCQNIRNYLKATNVTLRGEFIGPGVQGNIYNLSKFTVKIFDVLVDNQYLNLYQIKELMSNFELLKLHWVPILYEGKLRDWLQDKNVVQASHGFSMLQENVLREGIVIKPDIEQVHPKIGRTIIKQRDPIYLSDNGF